MTRLLRGGSEVLGRINAPIGVFGRNFAGGLLALMLVIVLAQVFLRYLFNESPVWTEELSKGLMVWSAFLVAPWSYRTGGLITIDLFRDALPPALNGLLQSLLTVLVIWIAGVMLIESIGLWRRGLSIPAATLPVNMAVFYSVVVLSFAAMILVGVEHLLRGIDALLTDTVADDAHGE